MAESAAVQKASYPLPVYNFRVTVDGESVSFAEASGLNIECETVTYRHGLSFSEGEQLTRYRFPKYTPMTLKKGTVARGGFLYDWLIASGAAARAIAVSLCDEKGKPVVVWRIAKAVPVKLAAPTFDANTNQVSIDTLDLMISGVSVEHP
ncbi:MAG: phage tail protein [Rhodospirillales bacterium]|jgi:phage tail-like protein|nr:phage tail protein [Rhodospirillales bacterium]